MQTLRLSSRQRELLVQCGLKAALPITELAHLAGRQAHTVRHDLQRMRQAGVIRKVWAIDCFRLGYFRVNVLFSLGIAKVRQREAFLKDLGNDPRTIYLGDVGGDYDFELGIITQNVNEIFAHLEGLSKKYADPFTRKSVSLRNSLTIFPRKYLSGRYTKNEMLSIGRCTTKVPIDGLDHAILEELSRDAWQSVREISQKLGRSVTTVDLRFRRLKEKKIIAGAAFSTNPAAYGAQNFIILLFTKGFHGALAERLLQFGREHPHCTHFVTCLGAWDYELGVEVEEHQQLVAFRDTLAQEFGASLQMTTTLARFGARKYSWYPM